MADQIDNCEKKTDLTKVFEAPDESVATKDEILRYSNQRLEASHKCAEAIASSVSNTDSKLSLQELATTQSVIKALIEPNPGTIRELVSGLDETSLKNVASAISKTLEPYGVMASTGKSLDDNLCLQISDGMNFQVDFSKNQVIGTKFDGQMDYHVLGVSGTGYDNFIANENTYGCGISAKLGRAIQQRYEENLDK